jgi:FixJ family two-component response regulator
MAHGTLKILIADDDDGDRTQLRRVLKQAELSHECVETADIEGALAACDKNAFDCAIVDYRMPGHDGLQGITALHERLPHLPIIMATGQGDETVATEAMKRGASDYISKGSIDAKSIRRVIENALAKATLRRKIMQQREELENFVSVLMHDLSAPIRSLQAFSHLIEEAVLEGGTDKNELIGYCRRLAGASRRTGLLIDTLYEYTRADAQVTYEPVEVRSDAGIFQQILQ